jgi:hypothetical protein
VATSSIVEVDDPFNNSLFRFFPGFEVMTGKHFVFQRGEERFGRGIVETRPGPTHRLPNAELVTEHGEIVRGIGRTTVGMEDHPSHPVLPAARGDSHFDGLTSEFGIRMATGGVAEQPTGEQVGRRREIELALIGRDLGHVADP